MQHVFEQGWPGRHVELFGETTDWRNGVVLPRTLDLPPGVYQYKLLADGREWLLDPANARTRSADGRQNSVLAIDAAPEPWLFAAAPPWIVEEPSGGIRVLVGARLGASVDRSIAWSEDGASWSRAALEPAFVEDEHAFFVASLPVSARKVTLALGSPRYEATWQRPAASTRAPAWWARAVMYGVFVDRFRPAVDDPSWERAPVRGAAAGGHLEGIRRSLEEIADLGATALYLTPVHVGASAHRYDIVDPFVVDPRLGGEDAYAALVAEARARGLRIIQDVSFAHVGRGFPAYEDVEAHADWFQWKDGALVHYGKRTDAPLLNLEAPAVQEWAIATIERWAKRGVSGLRLDMTAEIPLPLGQRIRRRFRELVPDGVVFGELVPQHAWRWRNAGVLDAATDFDFHALAGALAAGEIGADDAFAKLRRTELLRGDDGRAVRFLSTHDHVRLASRVSKERLACAEALLTTMPGIPMLLYGEEHALSSDGRVLDAEIEDVWPDRMPMPWTSLRRDPAHAEALRALLRARAESEALRSGDVQLLFADASTLVFRRASGADVVDVAINFDADPKELELEDDERPRLTVLAAMGGACVQDARVTLPPFSALIARRSAVARIAARRNLLLRDEDMIAGAPNALARPSRFFFAVTERCNLRCAHCITHAPALTQSGAARTMTPAVLAALAPHFALGDYFAFVHGGESLTAPIFFEVLAAIATARGADPWIAHLLTNGLLFDVAAAERLVRAGISSVSVSLDGATAATNDAIRLGGRFDQVTRQLEEVARWREANGVDLRLGISTVVLAQNAGELDAIVDLAADLGVDWLKLEEGVPATEFAKRSLVIPDARAIRGVVERGEARGLVMVDHTIERAIWRCRLEEDTRAFLAADEHANRGTIHPCRVPWETVCIEPNGDVRAGDFFGPLLGNAVDTPLEALWNADPAQRLRRESVARRLCGAGPVTCTDRS